MNEIKPKPKSNVLKREISSASSNFEYHVKDYVFLKIKGREGWIKGLITNVINSKPKRYLFLYLDML